VTGPRHRPEQGDFRWQAVEVRPYKPDDNRGSSFRDLSRQVLFDNADLACQVRFFDVEAGGHTTLERHEHAHGVIILAGRGRSLVGNRVVDLRPHDLVEVGPWEWHQFRAGLDDHLGFVCIVNRDRDRPQLPTAADLDQLTKDPEIAAFLGMGHHAAP
jgi:mannose-6-phosphate isomerase-like protein (cupin superfamily)